MPQDQQVTLEHLLHQIESVAKRMKVARRTNDKVGYELALREYERLHKEYQRVLYSAHEPTQVFQRR